MLGLPPPGDATRLLLVRHAETDPALRGRCYGRMWEKIAASVLTLFILATLLGIGTAIGLAVVWTYDTYA